MKIWSWRLKKHIKRRFKWDWPWWPLQLSEILETNYYVSALFWTTIKSILIIILIICLTINSQIIYSIINFTSKNSPTIKYIFWRDHLPFYCPFIRSRSSLIIPLKLLASSLASQQVPFVLPLSTRSILPLAPLIPASPSSTASLSSTQGDSRKISATSCCSAPSAAQPSEWMEPSLIRSILSKSRPTSLLVP